MTTNTQTRQQPVAIIGMGGMFAKSRNIKEYWRTLLNGIDCITNPPATHSQLNDYFDADPKKPDHIYCNRGGFLPTVPFDPTEFGIPPAALEATDTSQLLGLVAAKMALSDAGYGDGREFDREHTSVILGVTGTQELVISLGSRMGHPSWRKALEDKGLSDQQKTSIITDISNSYVPWQESSFPGLLGNVVAGRICNRLNLGGTNCVVDAACASSLGAVHLGIMELVAGKSNMVVTGGVDTINDIFMHMCFSKTGVLSHTGDARPFSADADGTVLGEGIGILVLKRLEDAERDGDRIYAVIRGIGSSSDGKSQSIYAPRPEGQARALVEAYNNAGISPETVDMVEAHGTGTRVGDEVEFAALKNVFGAINPNGNRCALGSVKSMIGHTKAAAGSAGLIKSALSLYNKVLPPTLKADKPDPKLRIESSPFYLNTTPRPWFSANGTPRRSGVSSFGFGGSNFHVVLEEYQSDKKEIAWDGSVEILAFSGVDAAAIIDSMHQVDELIGDSFDPAVLSRTARESRTTFSAGHPHRLVMIVNTTSGGKVLKGRLRKAIEVVTGGRPAILSDQGIYYVVTPQGTGKIAFMFPGQGSQYPNMGRDLVCRFPSAMEAVQDADRQFNQDTPLWEFLFPRPALSDDRRQHQAEALRQTDVAQPAIGAVSLAMLSILDYFNVRPDATCGHSYGELPALYAAGWINRETLLSLSVTRGRLMADAGRNGDAGTMLAAKAPIDQLKALADQFPDVVLANLNSPDQGVFSGTTAAIASVKAKCTERGYRAISLPVSAAFHSPLVEEARRPFSLAAGKAAFTPTRIPVYANVTAAPYPADPSGCTDLLSRQLTSPVRFKETVEHLYETGVRTFVEVGPKAVLSGLVRSTLKDRDITVIAVDRSSGRMSGIMDLAQVIGQLAALGTELDLNRWETELPFVRPQKMTIPLSGTNYRTPQKEKTTPIMNKKGTAQLQETRHAAIALTTKKEVVFPRSMDTQKSINQTVQAIPPGNPVVRHRGEMNPASSTNLNEALAIVRKGLESIQSLQQQTAQAHQKFLETQSQASRTLQEMMQSTRMFVGPALGMPMPAAADIQAPVVQPEPISPQPPDMETLSSTAATAATAVAPGSIPETTEPGYSPAIEQPPRTASLNAAPAIAAEAIARSLIDIVSELTGYPDDMLGLDMDIEADLGIDSIKRVEILSAMEERMPHLPQVTPDMVGTLKTLGQICDFLSAEAGPSKIGTQNKTHPAIPSSEGSLTVQKTLLSVVSELTGYPDDMLRLDMDIEADLGIDSIKRVEILSAMEERMPHLPQITPDMVGTLKTLGQICDFLSAEAGPSKIGTQNKTHPAIPSSEGSLTVQKTLLSVVSELTGYPDDMLGLDMDIEADLGIDSIKRVEILSAMEERMPHLPQITPDMVGTLKTLGQICDFLSAEAGPSKIGTQNKTHPAIPSSEGSLTVQKTLLSVVSELTGYPDDMLGLDMDIEADLGIDSIKRVEILSAMEERMPHLPQITPDMVGTLKTLGQICDFLSGGDDEPSIEPDACSPIKPAPAHGEPSESVSRQIIDIVESPKKPGRPLLIDSARWIGVLNDNSPMAQSMVSELTNKKIPARLIPSDAIDNALSFAGVGGLILCCSTDPETAFLAAKLAAPELFDASMQGDAMFAAITCMDGAFGFRGNIFDNPEQGALPGLVKTAALEWDSVICRAIDLSPDYADPDEAAQQVVAELLTVCDHDPVEIGLHPHRRVTLKPVPAQVAEGSILLDKKEVVVVTGGASGVTAACTLFLARATGVSIALVGRSAPPFESPAWLQGVGSEAAMKKAILENLFSASKPTPQTLEAAYRKYAVNHSITRTIDGLKASGVNAGYFSADVTDRASLHEAVATIRNQLGPITGLIHGAGVLHDRLIVDKTVEQFRQVYATKVTGLKNLLAATQSDNLRHLVLFSSVSARTGNTGQCDYAMANEVLNKMARVESRHRPACRVTAVNWGPWDGGMVTPALKKAFEGKGIQLIPIETGVRMMVAEMKNADPSPVEVLIGDMLTSEATELAEIPDTPMAMLERRELDLQHYPVLTSHIIGGKPVVPFALISEWIGHGAIKENPGFSLHGIDDFRLLSGIRIEEEKKLVRLMAGKARKDGDGWQVDVELRNGVKNGKDVIHTRARALLVDRFPAAPVFTGNGKNGSRAYPRDLDAVYGPILFHGDHLRAIQAIDDYSDHGMTARLISAPKPEAWMQDPIKGQWMADPMVLDGAFQMAIVWCYEQTGKVCLPSYARAYRQYRAAFPASGVTAVMSVTAATHRKMVADFTFLDSDRQVVATLNGYEATIDESLIHAFQNNALDSVITENIQ